MIDGVEAPERQSIWRRLVWDPLHELRGYGWGTLRGDIFAGATVAAVAVPQSMAYALIAGVPLHYGLYTLIVQGLINPLFSSNRYLSAGPVNTQSLLIAATATRLADAGSEAYLQLVIVLTLLKGLMQIGFTAARLGYLVRYVSVSVVIGFTAGAGVLIAVGQIPSFLGIDIRGVPRTLPGVLGALEQLLANLSQVSWPSAGVGLISLAIVVISPKVWKLLPGPLLAIVVCGGVVWAAGWTAADLPLVGALPSTLPSFELPQLWRIDWANAEVLLGGVIAMSLLGLLEAYSIGKSLTLRAGRGRISANRELLAQGMSNFASSFFQSIPGSVSFGRSGLMYDAGAGSRLASVFKAILVALVVLLLADQARHIPLAALAAVLFVISASLVDWRQLNRIIRTHRHEAAVVLTTFVTTLILPLQYAVYIGIFLNIALYLRRAGRLHMAEMVQTPAGPFIERPIHDRAGEKRVMFLQVEGDLFFAVADELHERLRGLVASGVRVVILRLKRTHSIDATVLQVFDQFTRELQSRGGHVLLCGVRPELMTALRSYGLLDLLGRENVFETGFGIFASAKQALARARQLVGASIDTARLDADLEKEKAEALTYEI